MVTLEFHDPSGTLEITQPFAPRLDTLNSFGFPPIAQVISGLPVLDSLNWEYSGTRGGQTFPGPAQDSLSRLGNEYLRRSFPRLDYIVRARVIRTWPHR